MHRFRLIAAILLGLWVVALPARALETSTLEIASKTGVHTFTVELAQTEAERAKGLMFRKELPEGQGMLFDFKKDQDVAFWMENTYISLDMIFIRGDGTIARIEQNTTPLSTRSYPCCPVPQAETAASRSSGVAFR